MGNWELIFRIWDNLWMFLAMLLGMSGKYFYDGFDKDEFKFELKKFIRPLFVSPMIFLLILTLIDVKELIDIGTLNITKIVLLSYLNGFFWTLGLDIIKKKFKKD